MIEHLHTYSKTLKYFEISFIVLVIYFETKTVLLQVKGEP